MEIPSPHLKVVQGPKAEVHLTAKLLRWLHHSQKRIPWQETPWLDTWTWKQIWRKPIMLCYWGIHSCFGFARHYQRLQMHQQGWWTPWCKFESPWLRDPWLQNSKDATVATDVRCCFCSEPHNTTNLTWIKSGHTRRFMPVWRKAPDCHHRSHC